MCRLHTDRDKKSYNIPFLGVLITITLTHKIDPNRLPGLRQAAYVLGCLNQEKTVKEIAINLGDDPQLAKMWVSFLLHNHWVEQQLSDTGVTKWVVTDKGKDWLIKYELPTSTKVIRP